MGKNCWIGLVQVNKHREYIGVEIIVFTTSVEPTPDQNVAGLYGDAHYTVLDKGDNWEVSSFDERDDWEQTAARSVSKSEGWEAVLALMQDDSYALVIPDGDVFF